VPLYLEDLVVGKLYGSDEVLVSDESIVEFARSYDPQPFHLDAEAAKRSVFGELVASGWQTAALTMRLRVTGELKLAGGWIGLAVEELKWPNPVRPGDRLRATTEVIEKRVSSSRPDRGVIKVRTTTYNQRDDVVFITQSVQLVLRREIPSP